MAKFVLIVTFPWYLLGKLWAAEQVSLMRQSYCKMVNCPCWSKADSTVFC